MQNNPTPVNKPEEHPAGRLRVLLCGYGHLGLALLQGMLQSADICDVVGVYRWASHPEGGRDWEPVEQLFTQTVKQSGLLDIQCPGMNTYEFTVLLEKLKPHVVLVGSWGEILKGHLLERNDCLLINCHPSKLPAHRGANPYASVILAQETETGVTFHRMAKKIDAGAILLQQSIALTEHDTGESVRNKCTAIAFEATRALLESLHAHLYKGAELTETEQDAAQSSYHSLLKPEDGLVAWESSATDIYRQCRALYPWISAHSFLEGRRLVWFFSPRFVPRPQHLQQFHQSVAPGTILAFQKEGLTVALADTDWVLELPAYQLAGWPMWLSRLLAPLFFRVGQRFRNRV